MTTTLYGIVPHFVEFTYSYGYNSSILECMNVGICMGAMYNHVLYVVMDVNGFDGGCVDRICREMSEY